MNQRQTEILQRLRTAGKVDYEEEAAYFGVTPMTVRRDLHALAKAGKVLLTRKGAVGRSEIYEKGTGKPMVSEQILIAERAWQLLQETPNVKSIMLSTGTTTLAFAQLLARMNPVLSVLTNSIPIASALFQTRLKVMLTGGELRSNSLDLVGPAAEQFLHDYHVDILFTGCDGADAAQGFYTADLNLANLENQSVKISEKVVILTASEKFTRKSLVKFAVLNDVDYVITDPKLGAQEEKMLTSRGVQVLRG